MHNLAILKNDYRAIHKFLSATLLLAFLVTSLIFILEPKAIAEIPPPTLPTTLSPPPIPSLDDTAIPQLQPPSAPPTIPQAEITNNQQTKPTIAKSETNSTQLLQQNPPQITTDIKQNSSIDMATSFIGDDVIWFGTLAEDKVATLTANLFCLYYNYDNKSSNKRCYVKQEASGQDLVTKLIGGEYQFLIIPSDIQTDAFNGTGAFQDYGKADTIRNVLPLYSEALVLLTPKIAATDKIQSLQNKKLQLISNENRKINNIFGEVLNQYRMQYTNFKEVKETTNININSICDNKIDAAIFLTTNPNPEIQQITQYCEVSIISLEDKTVQNLTSGVSKYHPYLIPKGTYVGNNRDIQTIAVTENIVSTTNVDNAIVENILTSIATHLETLQKSQPALSDLNLNNIISSSSDILPLHSGTVNYSSQ